MHFSRIEKADERKWLLYFAETSRIIMKRGQKEVRLAGYMSCQERQMGVIMNSNEWQKIGEDIKEQVQSAIDSGNFSELSRTISETVSQAIGGVGKSMNDAMNGVRESFQQSIQKTPHFPAGTGLHSEYGRSNVTAGIMPRG